LARPGQRKPKGGIRFQFIQFELLFLGVSRIGGGMECMWRARPEAHGVGNHDADLIHWVLTPPAENEAPRVIVEFIADGVFGESRFNRKIDSILVRRFGHGSDEELAGASVRRGDDCRFDLRARRNREDEIAGVYLRDGRVGPVVQSVEFRYLQALARSLKLQNAKLVVD